MKDGLPKDHLGWHVLCASTKRVSELFFFNVRLRKAKVCYFDVTIVVNEKVFGFEISIDDFLLVEIEESIKDFDEVELSVIFRHSFHLF